MAWCCLEGGEHHLKYVVRQYNRPIIYSLKAERSLYDSVSAEVLENDICSYLLAMRARGARSPRS